MSAAAESYGPGGGSRLIFGCMGLGGAWNTDPVSKADVAAAHQAVDAALEAGIRLFDHADIYRHGKAEAVFGTVLKERPGLRESIAIQTKCGIRLGEPGIPGHYDLDKATILARVDESLRRLGTEQVEVLLLHRPDPLLEPDEVAAAFAELRAAGKVRSFGVSNMSGEQMRLLQGSLDEPLVANQLEMSLARLDWLESGVLVNHPDGRGVSFPHGTLEYCRENGVELQAWGALAQGVFSGTASAASSSDELATADLVTQLAEARSTSPEAIVLGWLMKHPARIRPVIGTTNPERIRACAGAEEQAALMSRTDWYGLWSSVRGRPLP
ncbi:aldo/keto reductase family oxidoreductase [Paenarthrobacter sp. DKR-5]|uniref:aldo/keto reductase n=1 Tax=Paenarthrobacter sp. DKR-5 TaxID=2835535 RepID=UPI002027D2E9|nr:aldo/keto reductase [Paenarthrobacter sp. DKR-5]